MYAILQTGGHQYRVSPGDRLVVDRIAAEVGDVVALEPVLVVAGGEDAQVGSPVVEGARVAATVVAHRLGRKLRVFKYKPKKRYRKTIGHRSRLTELRVDALLAKGEPLPERAPVAEAKTAREEPAAEAPPRRSRRARSEASTEPTPEVVAEAATVEADEETPEATETPAPRRRAGSRSRAAAKDDAEPESAPPDDAGDAADAAGEEA